MPKQVTSAYKHYF